MQPNIVQRNNLVMVIFQVAAVNYGLRFKILDLRKCRIYRNFFAFSSQKHSRIIPSSHFGECCQFASEYKEPLNQKKSTRKHVKITTSYSTHLKA
ncbi:hypothetical protein HHI36_021248 [Cryptolaemus montrouzieri]|uniref:Uncharacterized protein n=1 Tax=Cryptolaemus montrouzieri TaxID=559131 RepID=A0ABD2MWN3_9CUCU